MTAAGLAGRAGTRPVERGRARLGMALFIVTEAALFAMLFFAYGYLGVRHEVWPPERPQLVLATLLTLTLVASSGTLFVAERALRERRHRRHLAWLGITIALGVVFLGLQVLEYRDHLLRLTPRSNAYGSIFYTITSTHGLHVLLGLGMLVFLLARLRAGVVEEAGRELSRTVSWYWHFVDVVWIAVFSTLYVAPYLYQ